MTTAAVLDRPPERRPYEPLGAARQVWRSRAREILTCGSADTGKSRGALEKLHYCADKYPRSRLIIVRKTRESITQSAMVTYEQKVLPEGWLASSAAEARRSGRQIYFSSSDQQYVYPNGSIIAVGGMDKPSKVMSSEWDMIYVQEATELSENDWETLSIRKRNGNMPYNQLLADCNPSYPTHWLKKRCDAGLTKMFHARFSDNPSITPERIAILRNLTGVRHKRLYLGLWAAAEGMVYDMWDAAIHLVDRFDIPPEWPRYWAIDWGFRNPFCWSCWAKGPDNQLYRYHEIYATSRLVEDLAREIVKVTEDEPRPQAVICDHDAGDRATFEKHAGVVTVPAKKAISIGIQTVEAHLRPDQRGKPDLYLLRDSLLSRDKTLDEISAPACTEEEFECYEWNVADGRRKGEEPIDKYNHGCLVAGTLIQTDQGEKPIEQIQAGEYVLTRQGYMCVKAAGMTQRYAEVLTVHLSNGTSLTGTADHLIYRHEYGYTPLHTLRYGDILVYNRFSRERTLLCQGVPRNQNALSIRASSLDAIPILSDGLTATTTSPIIAIASKGSGGYIKKSGKILTGLFQRAIISITEMKTHLIINFPTWNAYQKAIILPTMSLPIHQKSWKRDESGSTRYAHWPLSGINQKKAKLGIKSWDRCLGKMLNMSLIGVNNVKQSFKLLCSVLMLVFAQTTVRLPLAVSPGLITVFSFVNSVRRNFLAIDTLNHGSVRRTVLENGVSPYPFEKRVSVQPVIPPSLSKREALNVTVQPLVGTVAVLSMRRQKELQAVYNLTVENPIGEGEYFANGVLVHNCDALRYVCMHVYGPTLIPLADEPTPKEEESRAALPKPPSNPFDFARQQWGEDW